MRQFGTLFVVAIAGLTLGCTQVALERRTIKQASTLTDIQYQQVLDNLAMFVSTPDTMAWQLKLRDGLVQIADQGGAGLTGAAGGIGDLANSISPSASAQRTIVGQWSGEPTIAQDDLELLSVAYRKALVPYDKEVDREIRFQAWQLFTNFEFAPGSDILIDIMTDATEERFDDLKKSLDMIPLPAGSVDAVLAVKGQLDVAKDRLVKALNGRRLGSVKKKDYGKTDDIIEAVRDALAALDAAASTLEQVGPTLAVANSEELDDVLRRINHIRDQDFATPPESLVEIIKYINPVIARHLDSLDGWELRWMSKVANASDIPEKGKNLIVVAAVGQVLHFRIFDVSGKMVVDTDEKQLPRQAQKIKDLRNQLNNWGQSQEPTSTERDRAIAAVTSIVAHTPPNRKTEAPTFGGHFKAAENYLIAIKDEKYFVPQVRAQLQPRNPGLVDQAESKFTSLKKLLSDESFQAPWFHCGSKRDVPECACYVGHYAGCGRDCYVWVMPDQVRNLKEFTLTLAGLAPIERQDITFSGAGAAFSPR